MNFGGPMTMGKMLTPILGDIGRSIKAMSDAPSALTVESIDNHVYFYAQVDSDRCLSMIRQIREIDIRLRTEQISRDLEDQPPTPIWLHIQSPGGNAFAAFAAADELQAIKSPIYSIVEGQCASGATLISLAATKRFIRPNAFMLIHQLSSMFWGTHEQFEDNLDAQNKIMDQLVVFYADHSNMTQTAIRDMLKRDVWLTAEQCVAFGLADRIRA